MAKQFSQIHNTALSIFDAQFYPEFPGDIFRRGWPESTPTQKSDSIERTSGMADTADNFRSFVLEDAS
ncbi:MAG TPA: hypothetical protein VGD24_09010 [Gallionella sp.]